MSKKATKSEVIMRVEEILNLLLEGKTRSHIQQFAAESYELSERVIDEYIARASKQLIEMSKSSMEHNLSVLLTLQHGLLNKAISEGNGQLARQIIMDIAKLRKLDQQYINHLIDDKRDLAQLSDAELSALLGENEHSKH